MTQDLKKTANAEIRGFIPAEFIDNVYQGIHHTDEAWQDFGGAIGEIDALVKRSAAAGLSPAERDDVQSSLTTLHDEILSLMDRIVLFHNYCLKNLEFMPLAIQRIEARVQHELSIPAVLYKDPDYLKEEIEYCLDTGFANLPELQAGFDVETREDRKDSAWYDDFAEDFLDGAEITRDDMHARMEHSFFRQFDFPLGLYDVDERFTDYFDAVTSNDIFVEETLRRMAAGHLQENFPGFTLLLENENSTVQDEADALKQLRSQMRGQLRTSNRVIKPKGLEL